ncbi:MAG: NADH-quinone oxidoreductase subunit B [Planctomycetes bacterium]|nr:NADH-quinone oxidoreductase subunit B [Planctomycetota bacterium]
MGSRRRPGGTTVTERPGNDLKEQIQLTAVDEFLAWGKEHSLFYLLFATACCGIELMQAGGPRYDLDRLGMIPRATPRQADLMIVAGTITHKMASRVRTLWEQMTEPRWVVSMGSCANAGGPFSKWSYSVLNGIDKYVPVDIYIPGCPPRPEALIDGVMALRERVKRYRTTGERAAEPHIVTVGNQAFGGHGCAVPLDRGPTT